jgi:WD40 repeat protein/tetratricopeptide (TPR) repeat protein
MTGWKVVQAAAHDRVLIADPGHLTVWNAATERRECPRLAVGPHPQRDFGPASIDDEGRYLAYEVSPGLVEIRRVDRQGSLIGQFRLPSPVGGLIITSEAAMVVASCADGTVAQWIRATRKLTSRMDFPRWTAGLNVAPGGVDVIANVFTPGDTSDTELLEPSGKRSWFKVRIHAVIPCRDGYAITLNRQAHLYSIWDLNRGRLIRTIPVIEDQYGVFVSPRDDLFLERSPIPRIFDLRTGLPLSERLVKGNVTAACFSWDGKRLAIATPSEAVTVVDVATRRAKRLPMPLEGVVRALSFSSNGRFLATLTSTSVQIWDSDTGEPITEAMKAGQPVLTPLFSPDGSLVAVPSARALDVLHMQHDDRKLTDLRSLAYMISKSSGPEDASMWQMLHSKFASDFKFIGSRPANAGPDVDESGQFHRIYGVERSIAIRQTDADSLLTFAGSAARVGEWSTAADAARRCLALNNSDPAAFFMLAEAEMHLGRYKEATTHFKQARGALPGRFFESLLQSSYLRGGDYRSYAVELQSVIEPLSDTDQATLEYGARAIEAAYVSGDDDLTLSIAKKVFAPVREGRAASDEDLFSSSISLIPGLDAEYAPALELARIVYKKDPSPANRLTEALLLYRNGKPQEALNLAGSDPTVETSDDPLLRDAVEALCLTVLHRPNEAKPHLKRVLSTLKDDLRPGEQGGAVDVDERLLRLVLQKQLMEIR